MNLNDFILILVFILWFWIWNYISLANFNFGTGQISEIYDNDRVLTCNYKIYLKLFSFIYVI